MSVDHRGFATPPAPSRLADTGTLRHLPQGDSPGSRRQPASDSPQTARHGAQKGIKNGLQSTVDRNTDRFFALYADNVHRHGTPAFPKRYFETLLRVFGKDCEVLTITGGWSTVKQRDVFLFP